MYRQAVHLLIRKASIIATSNAFSGVGQIVKLGSGTLTLTGASTCGGKVSEGTLAVNGSLSGPVLVDLAGLLKGSGTVGPLENNGNVAPGNSIGTLNVAGNFLE